MAHLTFVSALNSFKLKSGFLDFCPELALKVLLNSKHQRWSRNFSWPVQRSTAVIGTNLNWPVTVPSLLLAADDDNGKTTLLCVLKLVSAHSYLSLVLHSHIHCIACTIIILLCDYAAPNKLGYRRWQTTVGVVQHDTRCDGHCSSNSTGITNTLLIFNEF